MSQTVSDWSNRRVLVTGCTGFLGSAVVRALLDRSAEVIGLVRDRASEPLLTRNQLRGRVRVVHGRVEDLFRVHSALAVHEIGTVFHLTGPVGGEADIGTATVVEAVRRYDPRTPVVTARPAGSPPLPEPSPPVALAVARFGEIFGPGNRRLDRIIPKTILDVLGGGLALGATRDGPACDHVYVDDAARACLLLAERLAIRPEPWMKDVTFPSGWVKTDSQMVALIREVFAGRVAPSLAIESPVHPLGWLPQFGLTEAMSRTIDWYRESGRSHPREQFPRRAAA
jgi:CDP-glucose 4,6-dehydratase